MGKPGSPPSEPMTPREKDVEDVPREIQPPLAEGVSFPPEALASLCRWPMSKEGAGPVLLEALQVGGAPASGRQESSLA